MHAELGEDLRADAIIAQLLRVVRRGAAGADLAAPAVSASGIGRLITTITPAPSSAIVFIAPFEQAAALAGLGEGVGEQAERVHPHQGRLAGIDLALDQGDLLDARRLVEEGLGGPAAAPAALELRLGGLLDELVLAAGDRRSGRGSCRS